MRTNRRGEGNQAEGTSRDTRCISTRFPYHVRGLEIAASSIKHKLGNEIIQKLVRAFISPTSRHDRLKRKEKKLELKEYLEH